MAPTGKKCFATLQKGQRKIKVNTIGIVHNYIIQAPLNPWPKVNVKLQMYELWHPQSSPRQICFDIIKTSPATLEDKNELTVGGGGVGAGGGVSPDNLAVSITAYSSTPLK